MNSVNRVKSLAKTGKADEIIQLVNDGYDNAAIKRKLNVTNHQIYYAKRTRKADIVERQLSETNSNIVKYDEGVSNILKNNILRIGNTITQIPLQKVSLSQLTTSMAIMIDKLRLLEGKSTANISTQILHNINPEQLEIIQRSIKSLKESMLNVE